jgi:protein ImuB
MPAPLYLCVNLCDFAAQVLTHRRQALHSEAVAVLSGEPPLERVFAMNELARRRGLEPGMSRVQAESFSTAPLSIAPLSIAPLSIAPLSIAPLAIATLSIATLRRNRQQEDAAFAEVMSCAEQFSPRIESIARPREESCGATLVLDVSDSERLLGGPWQIGTNVQKAIEAMGYEGSVAVSHNAYVSVLAARGAAYDVNRGATRDVNRDANRDVNRGAEGITVIARGCEAESLATLPLTVLELDDAEAKTFAAWGINTLGQLATLPTKSLVSRMGQTGFNLQAQARGEYNHLLVPGEEPADAALCESMELGSPVELLEPLLFLLSQMLERVTHRAERRALAIASVETCLVLDGTTNGVCSELRLFEQRRTEHRHTEQLQSEHRRTVRPTLPERDHRTLLKLIQLDLELHPPAAPVIGLRIEAHPARPQTAQPGLFAAEAPEAGRMEILLARLRKLVGENRVGAPELLDSHVPEAFRITKFETGFGTGTDCKKKFGRQNGVPRGLKPRISCGGYGTAEAVPFQSSIYATGTNSETAHPTASADAHTTAPTMAMRMVRPPRPIAVELREDAPTAMYYEGKRFRLQAGAGPWRTSGAWWTNPAWCREEWDVVVQGDVVDDVVVQGGVPKDCVANDVVLKEQPRRCIRVAHDPSGNCWYVIGIYD